MLSLNSIGIRLLTIANSKASNSPSLICSPTRIIDASDNTFPIAGNDSK